ncbi:MAG TPA: hypothetical protein VGY66_37330 [Gemmataceae bacterium]|jgi:hypothetical protein|nr:hypothetical protein [Gemmataceae bacterium]
MLIIDRYPFHCWTDNTRANPVTYWSARLPVYLCDPGMSAPAGDAAKQEWTLDTGNTAEAFAWRDHLRQAGLVLAKDPWLLPHKVSVSSAISGKRKEAARVRQANIWLVSNVPGIAHRLWRIELARGIIFRDVAARPDPELHRPLIGFKALLKARLRVELDFVGKTVSVWAPDSAGPGLV